MADVPAMPLEGTSAVSTEERPMLALTEDDGGGGLRWALLWAEYSEVINGQRVGALVISGPAAHDAPAKGHPVRTGGVYHSTPPTGADGDILDILVDDGGRVEIARPPVTTISATRNVAVANVSTLVLAAKADRHCVILTNDSDAVIYVQLGAAAVMNEGIRLNAAGGSVEINLMNLFTGAIYAICAAGGKNLCVQEW